MDKLKDSRILPIFIHSSIDDMTNLSPNAMRVYMHLARRAGANNEAWPSYQSVGDHCFAFSDNPSTRKSMARKAIDDLIESGLIEKGSRTRKDGGSTSNMYTLVDHEKQEGVPIGTGGANRHGGVPIGTKGTPIEDNPKKTTTTESSEFGEICTVYESNIGLLTPMIGDKIKDAMGDYPTSWIVEGIQAAVTAEARHWNYVMGCLKNWKREGKSTAEKQEEPKVRVKVAAKGGDLE